MKNFNLIYTIFTIFNFIELNHGQIQVNKRNIQFISKTEENKNINKNKYFSKRFLFKLMILSKVLIV